jgi:hypothetical protein
MLLLFVACAYVSDRIAERKGVRHAGYAVLGFVLGPFGVLAAVLRKPVGFGR